MLFMSRSLLRTLVGLSDLQFERNVLLLSRSLLKILAGFFVFQGESDVVHQTHSHEIVLYEAYLEPNAIRVDCSPQLTAGFVYLILLTYLWPSRWSVVVDIPSVSPDGAFVVLQSPSS